MRLIALNKPFGTICQFSAHETRASLGDWVDVPGVYPAGRLDADSEGLLLLTDDGTLQARIAEPRHKLVKRYWAQVEGLADDAALAKLAAGVDLGDRDFDPTRRDRRRQEPPSAPDDGRGRLSDAAARARGRRPVGSLCVGPGTRRVA